MTASTTTVIAVAGLGLNTCTSVATATVLVNPSPAVNATSASTAICKGETLALFGSGTAVTYSWNGTATGPNLNVTPTVTSTYTLAGTNNFGCVTSKTLEIVIYTPATLSVTANRPGVCRNEKIILTASGASSYTWVTQGIISPSVTITPAAAQAYTYQVQMKSAEGCESTGSYVLTVSACTGLTEQMHAARFKIWPNPSTGTIRLVSEKSEHLGIYTLLGQTVMHLEVIAEQEIQLEGLPAGIYLLRGSESGASSDRLIIQP
jgi:hypothetical protein